MSVSREKQEIEPMPFYTPFCNEINPDNIPCAENGEEEGIKENQNETINEFGQLGMTPYQSNIHVITIVGQVEGHLEMPPQNKVTKYEHIIPQLVAVEQSPHIKGLLVVLNTVGGDVEAGLAIAEMIASLSKPTASLVLGGGHSIGVPIAVAANKSFIAPTASMTIHPIRLTGLVVGVQQSFDYLERMQDRVIQFVTKHSRVSEEAFRSMMMTTGELARDVGAIVVGRAAVRSGLIDSLGGLNTAMNYLNSKISGFKEDKCCRDNAIVQEKCLKRRVKGHMLFYRRGMDYAASGKWCAATARKGQGVLRLGHTPSRGEYL